MNANDLVLRLSISKRALDLVNVPLLALDSSGRLLLINRAAARILRESQWLMDRDGRLRASRRVRERAAVTAALRELRRGRASELLLTDRTTGQQAALVTVPIAPSTESQCATSSGLLWILPLAPAADGAGLVSRLYLLTPAEQRLLERLASEHDLGQVADQLLVSRNTIRTQLKSLFRKTGLRSQTLLLALTHRLALLQDGGES